ncbi:type I 3-dehydroquinate dehydratase [Stenotrophomonas sp. S48]|uniref:type I 3-dehydroquinate dehydratase n=1 Tax=unclassified Stenotrophomonas TaxID=196198 RepID=UPI001901521A|nr:MULTISPECIES: type I 3-dehydroquinate dehydratase [unclassified Stenotrophomonas]MBK0026191.1 type I 3-dehydroquinate dehydratase [Stenotrophomonas sp. S48]MBK0050165.1 type I 3-dehydroquinate dehydratase [Stenotrophomonas sp. S49]
MAARSFHALVTAMRIPFASLVLAGALCTSPVLALAAPPPAVLQVGSLRIGEGSPRTIVPITGASAELALQQAAAIAASTHTDLAEWRIDYLDIATDGSKLVALGKRIQATLGGKPMIVTFRTKAEGGAKAVSDRDYGALYATLLRGGFAQLIDVEMFRDPNVVQALVAQAHKAGVKVVMSNHDFQATPPREEIVARLLKQQAMGADVLKIAVMPRDAGDVLALLEATWQVRQRSDKPLLTMSMGGTGVVSRLAGETFGQALTFGMIGTPSAPGQVEVEQLQDVLQVIHASSQAGR